MINKKKLNLVITSLPTNNWWGEGTPEYADNPAMKKGTIPKQIILEREWENLRNTLSNLPVDLEIIPFPFELDSNLPSKWKHDFVFLRDLFISNQKGDIVVARFREKERQNEEKIIENWLIQKNIQPHKLPFDKEEYNTIIFFQFRFRFEF